MKKERNQVIYEMKERVLAANLYLSKQGLVVLTWGNASEVNREEEVIVIKPSGIPYDELTIDEMVVTDLTGKQLSDTRLRPSSDLATHVVLYQHLTEIGGIVHTHSRYAVMWAQAGRDIPAYGTTHADRFYGDVPVTRELIKNEIAENYEEETGKVIVETFIEREINPQAVPGVIVNGHGPFTWGKTIQEAAETSLILDEVARMAIYTELINNRVLPISQNLLDKHYYRKHGANAYYGQN